MDINLPRVTDLGDAAIAVLVLAIILVTALIGFLMHSKHDRWVLPLIPIVIATSTLAADQLMTGKGALELGVLAGVLCSFDALVVGILASDEHHDLGLHRTKPWHLLLIGVLLVTAAAVYGLLRIADPLELSHGARAVAEHSNLFVAFVLGVPCMALSAVGFETGRTRACLWLTVPLLPIGCLGVKQKTCFGRSCWGYLWAQWPLWRRSFSA